MGKNLTNGHDVALDCSQTSVKGGHFGVKVYEGGLDLSEKGGDMVLPLRRSNGLNRNMLPLRRWRGG